MSRVARALLALVVLIGCAEGGRGATRLARGGRWQAPGPRPSTAAVSASRIATRVLHPGTGREHPASDDCIRLRFAGWAADGTLLSTSGKEGAVAVQCLRGAFPGVAEVLREMVPGEERLAWIPPALAFGAVGGARRGAPAPGGDVAFDLELVEILRAPRAPPDLEHPPRKATTTRSGLVMQVLRPGHGTVHPTAWSRVTLELSGWTVDGALFESTAMGGRPALYSMSDTLPGWREGLARMVVGEKARLWIPAHLAFGAHPRRHGPPAGSLVYDLELLAIE